MTPSSSQYTPISYTPIGGINSTDNEAAIEQYECAQGTLNFLFEGKEALTRPGLTSTVVGSNAQPVWWSQGINAIITNYILTAVGTAGRIWYLAQTGVWTEVTGPGTNFNSVPAPDFSAAGVNGVILIGGSSSGALRWDPAGNVYTVLATAPWKYVISHLSRAVGAFDLNVAGTGQRTLGWSVAGDETTWTGATNGSGRSIIADMPDQMTGLGVMRDVVVIFRQRGIHLAIPTGLAFPAYSIKTWNRTARGCAYPLSLQVHDNVSYFMSYDDVHTFDLVNMKSIGYKIRKTLFSQLSANPGLLFRGVLVRSLNNASANLSVPRDWYVLVPVWGSKTGVGSASAASIFLYDILEDTWSIHDFAASLNAAGEDLRTLSAGEIGFQMFDTASPSNVSRWARGAACERASVLKTRVTLAADDPWSDYLVERALLSYRNQGAHNVTVKVSCEQAGVNTTFQDSQATHGGATALWSRLWFNLRQNARPGQNFQVEIDIPAGNNFNMDWVGLQSVRSGDYRG